MYTQVTISISGYSKLEAEQSLPDLLEEIGHRPWLLETKAEWNEEINKVLVAVISGGNNLDLEIKGVLDEVWNCVIATFPSNGNTISSL